MANSTSPIPQVVEGSGAVEKINGQFDASSQALAGGRNAATSALLAFGVIGGRINEIDTANTTLNLTSSSTNYIVWKKSDGVISFSTGTTNWDNSAEYWRLYSVVTNSTTWISYTDERSSAKGLFGVGVEGMTNPMTTAEDLIKAGSSGVPARVAVGGDGQVLTVVDGVVEWANSAAGFANPMTTVGDLISGGTSGSAGRLAIGNTGDVLTVVAGVPAWAPPGIEQNSQSGDYTLVLADKGKQILHPSADTTARIWTIPANASVALPINSAVTFVNQNGAGVITIAITTDTMRLAGAGTTGSRTLAANGIATAVKITNTEWIISGTGLS